MLEFGFAVKEDGKLYISEELLARIINLDESCLSLDGSDDKRGGRPTISFHNPCLPDLGKCASKSSVTETFIGGSNAKVEALPPHIQLSTSAKSVSARSSGWKYWNTFTILSETLVTKHSSLSLLQLG